MNVLNFIPEGDMQANINIGKGCSLELRPSGSHTIRFRKTVNGKRYKKAKNARSADQIEAISEARDLWKRWQQGTFDPWRDVYKVAPVKEAVAHYMQTRGKEIKRVSSRTNEWAILRLCRDAGIMYISDIKPDHLRKAIYNPTLKEASKFSLYTKLNAVLNWMTSQGYFDVNPLDTIRKPRKPQRVPKALKPNVEARFIEALPLLYDTSQYKKRFRNPHWYADGALMALYTGATRQELPLLRWGDVMWPEPGKPGRIIIRRSKNQKDRAVSLILALPLLEKLERETRISDDPNEHILKTADGVSPISGPYLGRRLAAVAKLANMPNVGLHGLRHTFAVNMVRRGVSMRSVQMMLGHDDITTTMIYTELTSDDVMMDVERAFGK